MSKVTEEQFTQKARAIHGDKYNYTKVVYVTARLKVVITCLLHGDFEQTPCGHLSGKGCRVCSYRDKRLPHTLTQEQFIEKARAAHGDKYDYSESEYQATNRKVCIICPVHGPFAQIPNSHLSGCGCPRCGRNWANKGVPTRRVDSKESFVMYATIAHGNRYDYSQVTCTDANAKVKIICPAHGIFEQKARAHFLGAGCRKCSASRSSNSLRLSQEQFIEKARAAHGDKYDYSQAIYGGAQKKVSIICPEHGLFRQSPLGHLSNDGCAKCGVLKQAAARSSNTDSFIALARAVHGDKYDYSQVVYINTAGKIEIICPEHGLFRQTATRHTAFKLGCKKCSMKLLGEKYRDSQEQFIEKARAAHGDKYDYSQAVYVRKREKVKIICPDHGIFEIVAGEHTRGQGCAKCAAQLAKMGWLTRAIGKIATLYFVRIHNATETFYKVGVTYNSVKQRFAGLSTITGYHYQVVALYTSPNAAAVYDWEQSILETFSHLRYRPSIYFAGETECFTEADPILASLPFGTKLFA